MKPSIQYPEWDGNSKTLTYYIHPNKAQVCIENDDDDLLAEEYEKGAFSLLLYLVSTENGSGENLSKTGEGFCQTKYVICCTLTIQSLLANNGQEISEFLTCVETLSKEIRLKLKVFFDDRG